jgi:two-component system, NtrC family, nitrogen regulation sensor histidine kinase NtrY
MSAGNIAAPEPTVPPGTWRRFRDWAKRVGLVYKSAVVLSIAVVLSLIGTYSAILGLPPFGNRASINDLFLLLNLVLVLPLVGIIFWRVVQVWTAHRRGLAGSRLHIRLVLLFGLIAVIPTIIVAIFSYLLFSFGVQAWFSERVRTALLQSQAVAEAYLHEHQNTIRADVASMAADMEHESQFLIMDSQRLQQMVATEAALRSLTEAVVFDGEGRILARSGLTAALELEPVPQSAMQQADAGNVAVMTSDNDDRVRALVKLPQFGDVYLYVGRFIDPTVIAHMQQTQKAVAQYQKLEGERSQFQFALSVLFLMVGLLLLSGAVWVGLTFANRMARPIAWLAAAAEQVRGGNLSARVPEGKSQDEFGSLSRAFNRMTYQLETQRAELIAANRQLDERRRFTESVLAGVSAGVIGLDQAGRINLPNRSASLLLATELASFIGEPLAKAVPEMAHLFEEAARRPERLAQAQVELTRHHRSQTLLVRIAAERAEGEVKGYIVTFDDITELVSAQRKAAWADVARRIAHEIKNPLTPIQLAAERLKRRFLKEIASDPETFAQCADTIVRHVGDIGRMVDEFSAFARMPQPVFRDEDVGRLAREALVLQKSAHPEIAWTTAIPERGPVAPCDRRLVGQALTNLLQNAADAVAMRDGAGHIGLAVAEEANEVRIAVTDDGVGLPETDRARLTEPYVTLKPKGTGLGLAIVKKIMEDHGGTLDLDDRPDGRGARATLSLPISRDDGRRDDGRREGGGRDDGRHGDGA